MRRSSHPTSILTSKPETISGYIIVYSDAGMPTLESRTVVRVDDLHYYSVREGEQGRVFRLAEDFFLHELPLYIRLKVLLNAQKLHHQAMQKIVEAELEAVEGMIEEARKEDR